MGLKIEVGAEVPEASTTIFSLKTWKNIGLIFFHIIRRVSTNRLKVGILKFGGGGSKCCNCLYSKDRATLGKSGRHPLLKSEDTDILLPS